MITRADIWTALAKLGVDNWASLRRDANYVCPSLDWLAGPFLESWTRTLFSIGLTEWKEEVWDCEDISDLCMAVVKVDHAYFYRGEPAGIAFGGWGYIPDYSRTTREPNGRGHWINMAVVSEDPIKFAWFEPQIPPGAYEPVGLVTLSEREIQSCTSDVLLKAR